MSMFALGAMAVFALFFLIIIVFVMVVWYRGKRVERSPVPRRKIGFEPPD